MAYDKNYYEDRKKKIQDNFNKVVSEIDRLISLREQLKGQFSLITEMEKENKAKDDGSKKVGDKH